MSEEWRAAAEFWSLGALVTALCSLAIHFVYRHTLTKPRSGPILGK